MSPDEVNQLALDMYSGSVFTSLSVPNADMLGNVFMPLLFMNEEQRKDVIRKILPEGKGGPCGFIYAHMNDAGPRSINGMPCFFAVRIVPPDIAKAVLAKLEEIIQTMAKIAPVDKPK